jgi:beta-lactamase class A
LLAAVFIVLGSLNAVADSGAGNLASDLTQIARSSRAQVSVSLIDLGGQAPLTWNLNGGRAFVAASTYKLAVLMYQAQGIASGRLHPSDRLCFIPSDWEAGPFSYWRGQCLTRQTLAWRIGHYSDNTAAHIFVRSMGGSRALNAYARAHGASSSSFFYPNVTNANDLARLWQNEALGYAGGAQANAWLYPLLTHTFFERGVPAAVPGSDPVAHKVGFLGTYIHDAALVSGGPGGPYVLVVMTHGLSASRAWPLIARISARVWQYEASRAS